MPAAASKLLIQAIEQVIVGKGEAIRLVVAALLADGHVLIEDVPGTGKTMLARSLAKSLDAGFSRVQFTPDLLPSDLTGVSLYNPQTTRFEFRPGPIFSAILLADELNRATPRTQSALLEAMEERTVTVDGETRPLPPPFFVLATQNPVEQQGVYELPEAQLDRFLVRIRLGYPAAAQERRIIEAQRLRHPIASVEPVVELAALLTEREALREQVAFEPNVTDYLIRLVTATREHRDVLLGASPRGSLALYRMAQAAAWLDGQRQVTPDTIKSLAPAVLAHRLLLRPEARIGGVTADRVLEDILRQVPVPTSRMERAGSLTDG